MSRYTKLYAQEFTTQGPCITVSLVRQLTSTITAITALSGCEKHWISQPLFHPWIIRFHFQVKEDMWGIRVPFWYKTFCHTAEIQAVVWLWTHWRGQLILRVNSGHMFLNILEQTLGILTVCDGLVFLRRLDWSLR